MKMDDTSLENQILEELAALDDTVDDVGTESLDEPSSEQSDVYSQSTEDLPSLMQYVDKIRSQTDGLEKELLECDELLSYTSKGGEDAELQQLAAQEGMDVEALKQKVLLELEEEERLESQMELSNTTESVVTGLLREAQTSARRNISSPTTEGVFVTASEEVNMYPDSDTKFTESGQGSHNTDTSNQDTPSNETSADHPISNDTAGAVSVIPESVSLERQMLQEVLALDHRNLARQRNWLQEKLESAAVIEEQERANEARRVQSRHQLQEEQQTHSTKTRQKEEAMRKESDRLQAEIQQSLKTFEKEMELMSARMQRETEDWRQAKEQEDLKRQKQRHKAALVIQTRYRGYRVRRLHGEAVAGAVAAVRAEREAQHLQELEIVIEERDWQQRRAKQAQEKKRLQEEEEKKIQEETLKKEKEEKEWLEELEVRKRKEAEEKRRKEEEDRRKEEEKRKKEEEKKRKEEEKKRKEEEKKKKEEEKKRKEAEKKKKEEEDKVKKEEKRKQEEKLKKEEAQKKEEERLKNLEEEKKKKEEIEEAQKTNGDLLENGIEEEDNETKLQNGDVNVQDNAVKTEKAPVTKSIDSELASTLNRDIYKNSQASQDFKQQTNAKPSVNQNGPSTNLDKGMNVVGQHLASNERGMTDLLIDAVGTANGMDPTPSPTPRKIVHKTPRPPSEQKLASVVYERPHSAKKKPNSPNQNSTNGLYVGTPRKSSNQLKMPIKKKPDVSREWGEILPTEIESLRMSWIKQCKPLSQLMSSDKPVNRKPLRRPSSAKKLSPLPEQTVMTAAAVSSLREVSTVSLSQLPGCTLSTLRACPDLQVLCISDSQLPSTDGLAACIQLRHLSIQRSGLSHLSLRDLPELVYVDVSHNAITSLSGLEGCTALRHLDVSHNNITRLGDLFLKDLHTLNASCNQLVSSRGLSSCVGLQSLDLSHNHLSALDDLASLPLLQKLNVSHNALMQVPALSNHVLLQHVDLCHNSLSFLASLARAWLPLLTHLLLDDNSVGLLEPLLNLVLLQHLQLANNQVSDLSGMVQALANTRCLRSLMFQGNPVCEDTGYREEALLALPYLQSLDGATVSPRKSGELQRTEFERLCEGQVAQCAELSAKYRQALGKPCSLLQQVQIHKKYFEASHQLAVDFRYTHEYGVSMVNLKPLDVNFDTIPINLTPNKVKSEAADMKSKFEAALQGQNSSSGAAGMKSKFEAALQGQNSSSGAASMKSKFEAALQGQNSSSAATDMKSKFEAALLGNNTSSNSSPRKSTDPSRTSSKDTHSQSVTPNPSVQFERNLMKSMAMVNQAATNSHQMPGGSSGGSRLGEENLLEGGGGSSSRVGRLERGGDNKTKGQVVDAQRVNSLLRRQSEGVMQKSAVTIQSWWRGVHLRKQLDLALTYARMGDLDDLESFGEVDMGELDFIMADLDKDLEVPDTPALPRNYPVLGKPPSGSPGSKNKPVSSGLNNHSSDQQPDHKQAWRSPESALSGRPPLPPLSRLSDNPSCDTHRSRKTDRIAEDWGFKDAKTAELMMARAKKLKYNAANRHKLSQLDPKQRLALFRKLGENSKMRPLLKPRKQLPRKEYFQAREMEVRREQFEQQLEQQGKSERTFEWVHTQVEMGGQQTLNRAGMYGSEGSLPRMEPSVMAGHTRLVGSPIDLQSVESSSTLGEPAVKPRKISRHSAGAGERLPPIQPTSVPTVKVQERMSFRNPPTNTDVGWGGGKKRNKRM